MLKYHLGRSLKTLAISYNFRANYQEISLVANMKTLNNNLKTE